MSELQYNYRNIPEHSHILQELWNLKKKNQWVECAHSLCFQNSYFGHMLMMLQE